MTAYAQSADTSGFQARAAYVKNLYKRAAAEQLPLFTGPIYRELGLDVKGNPFLINEDWQPGSVILDLEPYEGLQVKYDIYKNEVLVRNFNGQAVSLAGSRLAGFSIAGRNFVPVPEEMSPGPNKPLFFEQLYDGKVDALAKRLKFIEKTLGDKIEREYYAKTSFYILKDEKYFEVGSNGAILNVFNDKKSELRNYLRVKNLNFRTQPERVLIELSQQYDLLTTKL